MKKILILADGEVAEQFVARIVDTYTDTNLYEIVYYRGNITESEAIHCHFHCFDPTSLSKLQAVFSGKFEAAFIMMQDEKDTKEAYKNVRSLDSEIKVFILEDASLSNFDKNDENLQIICAQDLLANHMMAFVPNIPVSVQYVGLGIGEIIEAQVPFGSSYAYRHIRHIEQKKWRVAAIYRNNELILPMPNIMIRPGDNLLLIGEPKILKSVYRAIKIDSGQFPAPYGRSLYAILDISQKRGKYAIQEFESVLHIQKRLKQSHLYIKVINPDNWKMLNKLRETRLENVYINVEYNKFDIERVLREEFAKFNTGLLIVSDEFFRNRKMRVLLNKFQKPIWKLGQKMVSRLKSASLLLTPNPAMEQLSAVFFDLSAQLGISATLYPANSEDDAEKVIVEHYENIAAIHSRSLEIKEGDKNSILRLRHEKDHLLFFPFNERIAGNNFFDIFSPKRAERMYNLLYKHHQIFVPAV
ncbi:MAG: hypothetical protein LBU73_06200 [Helicobacteraceae bacterium]|jgi:hypothetical protein|nr:hypothetical protein [Helicobacteraceae bacterium]